MAEKEPWDKEIYKAMREDSERRRSGGKGKKQGSNKSLTSRALTFTVVTMFLLVGFMIAFILWNNQTQQSGGFAQETSENKVEQNGEQQAEQNTGEVKPEESTTVPSETTEDSSAEEGATYTIVAGDDPSKIAAKTGVDWSVIARLNNISATGYNADGSAISPGQVLKLRE
ncbi:MAG TPA: LysM domain-containing protein [Lactococcus sp.]|uniref:SAG1386/EF1546 family surface-associated protein n=1 Tax=Lactococcus muris TaxID=2941330 RepID=A0ABV4DD27_9LACT|nr:MULTISPECIES: SAG1386/EF1546 family surface-associated protein [Lactococcus]MBL3715929.1 LysM peptidoglycan-binding domain-containing protein [Lactococcus garvieae]HAP14501.1 LysM domain-containing protein [Lactococcus sp.]HBC90963.1 LysM domain-containing protein [Lactococcus sp.]